MVSSSSALEEMMVQWEEQKVMWMEMRMKEEDRGGGWGRDTGRGLWQQRGHGRCCGHTEVGHLIQLGGWEDFLKEVRLY